MILHVYLGGPIKDCTDEEIHEWREYVKNHAIHYRCYDPTRRDFRNRKIENVDKEIVELDKIEICKSDILLANLLLKKPMVGTTMEIIYAWDRGKYVILIHPENERISPWYRYHAHKIVHTLDGGIQAIMGCGLN